MPKTKAGNRTAWVRCQIWEDPSGAIYIAPDEFNKLKVAPIYFSKGTGQSGKGAHEKLRRVLDAAEATDPDPAEPPTT